MSRGLEVKTESEVTMDCEYEGGKDRFLDDPGP